MRGTDSVIACFSGLFLVMLLLFSIFMVFFYVVLQDDRRRPRPCREPTSEGPATAPAVTPNEGTCDEPPEGPATAPAVTNPRVISESRRNFYAWAHDTPDCYLEDSRGYWVTICMVTEPTLQWLDDLAAVQVFEPRRDVEEDDVGFISCVEYMFDTPLGRSLFLHELNWDLCPVGEDNRRYLVFPCNDDYLRLLGENPDEDIENLRLYM